MFLKKLIFFLLLLLHLATSAQENVDFLEGNISVEVNAHEKSIQGYVDYTLEILSRTDSVVVDARQMEILGVTVNRKEAEFKYDDSKLVVYRKFREGKQYELRILYKASPKKAVYFIGWEDDLPENNQVWTQGQGKYSSNWVPSFDDMGEKVIYNLEVAFDKSYELAANGKLSGAEIRDSVRVWKYNMEKPMSSYLLAFTAGLYVKDTLISSSGIPIFLYSYPDSINRKEPTYRYTKEIMDYLEQEIGYPYPWQNYKQIPVRDFLYAGMENTGTTIFSDSYYIDSIGFIDKNFVDVNAHELAHQWFGNLVTELSAEHHWLHEGFATYYSQLAQREIFGEDHYYWKLFETAEILKANDGEALTDPKASSLTFYEKGAWALVILRDLVGDDVFKNSVREFLGTYQFGTVTIEDFLRIVGQKSQVDLSTYRSEWLESKDFQYEQAKNFLMEHSPSVDSWYKLRWELTTSKESNEHIISRYWDEIDSYDFKTQVLSKFIKSLSPQYINEILKNGSTEVRRAVALFLDSLPPEVKEQFATLLRDPSYVTVENALFKLWIYFPDHRADYLKTTKGIYGLPNFNVRILWLFLAVLTNDFESDESRVAYREELFGYTDDKYSMEIRQYAFTLITEVFDLPDKNLKDLVNASVHHSWQFRNYARSLLKDIMKDEKQRARLNELAGELNGEEQRYLIKELDSK